MLQGTSFRRARRYGIAAVGAGLALSFGLTACAASDPVASGSGQIDSITLAYRNEVTTIDPLRADYVQTDSVVQAMYDTLVAFDEDGQMVGSLAETFEYNDTVDEIRITLRDGVVFHDGSELTAADVAYSLDRYSALGIGIAGQISGYDSVAIEDDHTFTIRLSAPNALFLSALSRVYILNSELVQANEGSDSAQNWLLTNDAGSGPYSLASISGGTYEFERFDDYWGFDEARPEALVMRRIDEVATIRDEIVAGNVDVGPIDPNDAEAVEGAGAEVTTRSSYQAYVFINNSFGATADPVVREVIRLAYDYEGGLESFRAGQGTIADGPLPASLACRPDLPEAAQDLDAARALVEEHGLDGLTLTLRYQPAFAEQAQEATLLQSNLAEVGIDLVLEPIAFADYLTMLGNWESIPELMLATESAPVPDAGVMVTRLFWSEAVGTNKMAYSNPEVDALIEQASAQPDADARCELYAGAQELIDADDAVMPLYTIDAPVAHAPEITGAGLAAANGSMSIVGLRVAD